MKYLILTFLILAACSKETTPEIQAPACAEYGVNGVWRDNGEIAPSTVTLNPDCTGYEDTCDMHFSYELNPAYPTHEVIMTVHSSLHHIYEGCPKKGVRLASYNYDELVDENRLRLDWGTGPVNYTRLE